jgi:F-type H+-transporting ATPase subunit a
MNNQLKLPPRVRVSHVHSYIRDFNHQVLNPNEVFTHLYSKIEQPNMLGDPISDLFRNYGISGDTREPVFSEIKNLLDVYLREAEMVLPPSYDITDFCEQFLGPDSPRSLKVTFADLFFNAHSSFTWQKGVVNVLSEIWDAEQPYSPFSDPDSPPDSPFVGADSPQSVFDFAGLPVEAGPANEAGIPGVGGPVIDLSSPLDQFSIHPIMDLHIGNYDFSFTNPSLSMLLTLGLVLLLVFVVTKKGGGKSVPNAWQSLVELIYDFVPNLVNEQIGGLSGNVKQKFFPRISVTFTFLLFCNLQGMIPFSFTVTSHFLITLALSFSIFIGITIVGFQRHGLHFFSFLLPAGVPLPLAPFLVLLELISHCFRALSSGIRLFANMMAGHSSVKILSGFAWTMLFLNNIFYFIGDLGPLFIVLALTGLELGVAISQAHVSTISICIYLNDATNLHQNE